MFECCEYMKNKIKNMNEWEIKMIFKHGVCKCESGDMCEIENEEISDEDIPF